MLDAIRKLWSPVEVRTEIDAAPADVFAVLAEPTTYPDWLVGAKRIRRVDGDFPNEDAEFDHTVGAGPVSIDDSTEVVEVQEPERLVLRVHAGPVHGIVELLVLPSPKGTEVRFRERPIGALAIATPALRPTLQARNGESLRQLRDLVEERGAAGAKQAAKAKQPAGKKRAAS